MWFHHCIVNEITFSKRPTNWTCTFHIFFCLLFLSFFFHLYKNNIALVSVIFLKLKTNWKMCWNVNVLFPFPITDSVHYTIWFFSPFIRFFEILHSYKEVHGKRKQQVCFMIKFSTKLYPNTGLLFHLVEGGLSHS